MSDLQPYQVAYSCWHFFLLVIVIFLPLLLRLCGLLPCFPCSGYSLQGLLPLGWQTLRQIPSLLVVKTNNYYYHNPASNIGIDGAAL